MGNNSIFIDMIAVKVVLLVGLFCTVGMAPSEALVCKTNENHREEQCPDLDEDYVCIRSETELGCSKPEACPINPGDQLTCMDDKCCCLINKCNSLNPKDRNRFGKEICDYEKFESGDECNKLRKAGFPGSDSTATTGLFQSYFGGFPLTTLLTALSIYYATN